MQGEIYVSFYKSPSGKQNMWIDSEMKEGVRYQINNINDAKECFQKYIEDYFLKH